jgi:hypothetical protein
MKDNSREVKDHLEEVEESYNDEGAATSIEGGRIRPVAYSLQMDSLRTVLSI